MGILYCLQIALESESIHCSLVIFSVEWHIKHTCVILYESIIFAVYGTLWVGIRE